MSARGRGKLVALFVVACAAMLSGCCPKCKGFQGPVSIEIVPTETYAIAGTQFVIGARLRNAEGEVIPEVYGFAPSWKVSPVNAGLEVTGTAPSNHTMILKTGSHPPVETFQVIAAIPVAGSQVAEDRAFVNIVQTADLTNTAVGSDRVLGDHDPANPTAPAVSLWTGRDGNVCRFDVATAFAGAADLPEITENTLCQPAAPAPAGKEGQIAAFFTNRAADYASPTDFDWGSTPADIIDFSSQTVAAAKVDLTPREPLVVALKIWVEVTHPDWTNAVVAQRAVDQVALASRIFLDSRVGIEFVIKGGAPEIVTGHDLTGATCGTNVGPLFDNAAINVYYTEHGGNRGFTCHPANPTDPEKIFITVGEMLPTTLAHELGHALALNSNNLPLKGHTAELPPTWAPNSGLDKETRRYIAGFDDTNLMWPVESDATPEPRSHLSLGQAFRMNMDPTSFVNRTIGGTVLRAGLNTLACKVNAGADNQDPYCSAPCPRLYADVVPLRAPLQPFAQCRP